MSSFAQTKQFIYLIKKKKKSENNTYSLLLYIYTCFKPKPKINKQIAPSKIMGKIKDITILIKLRSTFSNIFPAMFFDVWSLVFCSFHRKRPHFRIEKNQTAKTWNWTSLFFVHFHNAYTDLNKQKKKKKKKKKRVNI